jgi:hypothetical protein
MVHEQLEESVMGGKRDYLRLFVRKIKDHKYEYPPYFRNTMQDIKLPVAQNRSSSITAQIQRQPKGGACFMTA